MNDFSHAEDPLASLSPEQEIYRENILDHYKHPRNKRTINADGCLRQDGRNPSCGDNIIVSLLVDGNIVRDAAFEGSGCAISQASASMLTEFIVGKTPAQVLALDRDDIVAMLGIPIGPVRMKCALLGLRTAQAALENKTGTTTE